MAKKILISTGIFSPDIGGPASYANELCQKLSGEFSFTVLTYSSAIKHPEDKKYPYKVVRVWRKMPSLLRYGIYFFRVIFEARRHDLILVLTTFSGGIPGIFASRLFKKKVFVRIAGDKVWETVATKKKTRLLIDEFQKSRKSRLVNFLFRLQGWVCKKADKVIVPSEYLASIVKDWGVSSQKIEVIYNGVDFKPAEMTSQEARIKIGISGNILLSVGRLVPWKGFKMLVKIMPELLKINQFFRLVIVGDGPELKDLKTMVKNLSLEKKVYLVGKKTKEELAIFLRAADIFVLNTGYEGFSHQILEAMVSGLPVITTFSGGNKEIIHQGENGFMVKYNDEFNLLEAIKTLWNNKDLRQKFTDNGLKTSGYFSIDKMIKETTEILS